MATATNEPARLPPGPRMPKLFQGIAFLTSLQFRIAPGLSRRYGGPFTINLPIFGKAVVVSDPVLVKDVYSTSSDLIERSTKILGEAFGPGATFSLTGDEHLQRRNLVLPNFHGKRAQNYERLIEEEVIRETADWPQGREFKTLPTMGRLTLTAILRAVFGEEKPALDDLRTVIPAMIELGSLLHLLPAVYGRNYGRWSPGARLSQYRHRLDTAIDSPIPDGTTEPALAERSDVLALLLQARYDDGQPIPDRHIAD